MEWYHWCRLCGKEDGNQIINKDLYNTSNIVQKLLLSELKDDIKTPKSICSICNKIIQFLEKFSEKVRRVENMFLEIHAKYIRGDNIDINEIRAKYNFQNSDHIDDNIKLGTKPIMDSMEHEIKINTITNSSCTSSNSILNDFTKTVSEHENLCNEYCNDKADVNYLKQIKSNNIKKSKFQKQQNNNVNLDEKIKKFECEECHTKFIRETNYIYHLKRVHNVVKTVANNFSCTVCNKICKTKQNLKFHMELHLPPEEREKLLYKCSECDQKFTQKGTMRSHIRARHSFEKPFICEECGKKFASQRNLWAHKRSHDDQNHLKCSKCPKIFKNKFRLKVHMQGHNDSSHRCPKCGLILKTINTLKNHMLVHSDIKAYLCKYCNKAFKRDKNLQMHLITHSGLRPFICRFCNQGYANRSNCKKHEKHSHKKEYEIAALNKFEPEPKIVKKLPNIQQLEEMLKQIKSEKENILNT